ncbi:hypothetical protein IFM89_004392, partial [Coptis chinensis]
NKRLKRKKGVIGQEKKTPYGLGVSMESGKKSNSKRFNGRRSIDEETMANKDVVSGSSYEELTSSRLQAPTKRHESAAPNTNLLQDLLLAFAAPSHNVLSEGKRAFSSSTTSRGMQLPSKDIQIHLSPTVTPNRKTLAPRCPGL